MGIIYINRLYEGENKLKNYKNKSHKTSLFTWLIGEAILIFAVATVSIALYDMYIKIEVTPYDNYTAEKTKSEVSSNEDKEDVSNILENVSKSIVRNIKNNIK